MPLKRSEKPLIARAFACKTGDGRAPFGHDRLERTWHGLMGVKLNRFVADDNAENCRSCIVQKLVSLDLLRHYLKKSAP